MPDNASELLHPAPQLQHGEPMDGRHCLARRRSIHVDTTGIACKTVRFQAVTSERANSRSTPANRLGILCRLAIAMGLGSLLGGLIQAMELPAKPNFVFINIDDLGYADIGPFGSTLNRTPNLEYSTIASRGSGPDRPQTGH